MNDFCFKLHALRSSPLNFRLWLELQAYEFCPFDMRLWLELQALECGPFNIRLRLDCKGVCSLPSPYQCQRLEVAFGPSDLKRPL